MRRKYFKPEDLLLALQKNKRRLGKFVDELYDASEHSEKSEYYNELFGLLEDQGFVTVLFADSRAWAVSLTPAGQNYNPKSAKQMWLEARMSFVLLNGKYRDDLLKIMEQFPQDSTIPQGSEFEASIQILRTKGYLQDFEVFVNGTWSVSYTYDDLNYHLLEEDYLFNRGESSLRFSIEGGSNQINVANDNATIHATQNIGIDTSKLAVLIKALREQSKDLTPEKKQSLEENLEVIQSEFLSGKPKKSFINTAITALKAINGTAQFAAAVAMLIQFLQSVT